MTDNLNFPSFGSPEEVAAEIDEQESVKQADKPQLTVSMMDTLSRCGIQFQRRYGHRFGIWHEEEIIPPGVAMLTGTAVHSTVKADLQHKIDNGELLAKEQIRDLASDNVKTEWNKGVMLTDEEAGSIENALGDTIDQAISLSVLHHNFVAPLIQPVALEEAFVLKLIGYDIDLAGRKDIREVNGNIRDTKTARATPPEDAARTFQVAMYSMSELVQRGKYPDKVTLDYLVKTKTAKVEHRSISPDDAFTTPLRRRIERAIEVIRTVKEGKQALTPADPTSFICSSRYCGFSSSCQFFGGRK